MLCSILKISGGVAYYIGITDFDNDNIWTFYGTDIKAPILDFKPGDNDPQGEYCSVMLQRYDFQWADVPSGNMNAMVCEME